MVSRVKHVPSTCRIMMDNILCKKVNHLVQSPVYTAYCGSVASTHVELVEHVLGVTQTAVNRWPWLSVDSCFVLYNDQQIFTLSNGSYPLC